MTWLSNEAIGRLREVAVSPELPPDRYEVLEVVGRGGMGTVFAARDLRLERTVAIKVSNAAASTSALERRLATEFRVLARLEHPGIVPVHDAGVLGDGRWFYVMKMVRGETLADRPPARDDEAAVLTIFERVVETAAFAHTAGVVHRDLKPSNVMLGSFGEVLVLDWGVARVLDAVRETGAADQAAAAPGPVDAAADPRTTGGTRLGTPGFMAPEQARGDAAEAGPPADVYALGALLLWMLTGSTPSDGSSDAARRQQAAAATRSTRLRGIILKCLSPEPTDRYADAPALRDDVARYRSGAPVSAHRDTALERLGHWFKAYRTFILLVLTYLVMRALFAYWQS